MEFLLIIIVLLLVLIVHKFAILNSKLAGREKHHSHHPFSTLNAIFNEEEIEQAKKISRQWEQELAKCSKQLIEEGKSEVENFKNNKKRDEEFKLSHELKSLVLKKSLIYLCNQYSHESYMKMIESNIKVLNGASIQNVELDFWQSRPDIPIYNFDIIFDPKLYLNNLDLQNRNKDEVDWAENYFKTFL